MGNLSEIEKACAEFHVVNLIDAAKSLYGPESAYIISALYSHANVIAEHKEIVLSREAAKGPSNEWLLNIDKVFGHG